MTHQFLNWGQKILADYCCMNLAGFFFFQVFLFNHFEFFVIDTSIDKLLKTSVIAKPQPPTFVELRSISFVRSIHNSYFFPPLLITSFFPYDFPYFTEEKETPPIEDKIKKTLKTTETMEKLKKPTTCIDYIKCIKMLVCQANNKCGK